MRRLLLPPVLLLASCGAGGGPPPFDAARLSEACGARDLEPAALAELARAVHARLDVAASEGPAALAALGYDAASDVALPLGSERYLLTTLTLSHDGPAELEAFPVLVLDLPTGDGATYAEVLRPGASEADAARALGFVVGTGTAPRLLDAVIAAGTGGGLDPHFEGAGPLLGSGPARAPSEAEAAVARTVAERMGPACRARRGEPCTMRVLSVAPATAGAAPERLGLAVRFELSRGSLCGILDVARALPGPGTLAERMERAFPVDLPVADRE